MELVVINKEDNEFIFLSKKKKYQIHTFNTSAPFDDYVKLRRYIYDKIQDLSRNKRKYNLYIIVCNKDIYSELKTNYVDSEGLLQDKSSIFLSFREFKTSKYLIL